MKTHTLILAAAAGAIVGLAAPSEAERAAPPQEPQTMELGAFSISLAVKDLAVSRAFYETLGFHAVGGNAEHRWLVMRNGTTTVGLFQGMFESNILTFNPGWAGDGNPLDRFQDVRDIQAKLKDAGVPLLMEADPDSDGPAHLVLQDPDGNQIMFDQHVAKPGN